MLALGGLATAFGGTLVSSGKFGSASNYWMEPCVAGVAILNSFPLPRWRPHVSVAGVALLQALWTCSASIRSSVEAIQVAPVKTAVIGRIRELCGAKGEDVVMADDGGIELATNRRLVLAPGQLTPLTRLGRYPLQSFIDDVRRPQVACLVTQNDLLERPLDDVDPDYDLYGPELRRALRERFGLAHAEAGLWIYRQRVDARAALRAVEPR